MNLDNIRIVLVGTTHPGNIGAAARAMKTMGLSQLHLVAPEVYPSAEATANAANATDVLEGARVHASLGPALEGAALVAGLSARSRRLSAPALSLREFAPAAASAAAGQPIALLFGREHSGLTNDELDYCNFLVHIPANPDYGVLNLAAAVQVVCYELRMTLAGAESAVAAAASPAAAEHLEGLYQHLERVCRDVGFMEARNERILMRRLRRLFNRAQPDLKEVNILRGMLSYFERRWRP